MADDIATLVAAELAEPVDPRVTTLAGQIATRHGAAARAVLFYGSCLRERQLDGLMLDFYLIVSDYRAAYDRRWLAWANRLIPPNVFPFAVDGLAAKYAVLSEADFARLCGPATDNPSIWARFAQPSRLVWAADDAAQERAVAAVTQAAPTLLARTIPKSSPARGGGPPEGWWRGVAAGESVAATTPPPASGWSPSPSGGGSDLNLWRDAFALTYGAELRAERQQRSASIVDIDPDRYRRFTTPALAVAGTYAIGPVDWSRTQRRGKRLTLLRLAKASFTFAGGLDYLAWKINRHAGAGLVIKPWQRRWPILGAITLLPRLLARGAVR
jgi:hypothetical protein